MIPPGRGFSMEAVEAWHDFYTIIGGAAAGLTGLMFVVVTLGPRVIATRDPRGVHGFITPTIVYFATVLVLACIMVVPGIGRWGLMVVFSLGGIGGPIYLLGTGVLRQWRESELGRDDWFWYIGFPLLAYLLILGGAVELLVAARFALHTVALALICFIVIGIRNAWDLVLWMAQKNEETEQ